MPAVAAIKVTAIKKTSAFLILILLDWGIEQFWIVSLSKSDELVKNELWRAAPNYL
jgi:hypothetical protein